MLKECDISLLYLSSLCWCKARALQLGKLVVRRNHRIPYSGGISLRSVQRIWAAHGLQPHRVRRFKLSQDPAFAAKLRDVVGLHLDPPAHSLVLSVDEKSQIQALDALSPACRSRRVGPGR
jgi:hypothetical protein